MDNRNTESRDGSFESKTSLENRRISILHTKSIINEMLNKEVHNINKKLNAIRQAHRANRSHQSHSSRETTTSRFLD